MDERMLYAVAKQIWEFTFFMNRKTLHWVLKVVIGLCAFLNVAFFVVLKTPSDSVWPFLRSSWISLQGNIPWLWVLVAFAFPLIKAIDKRYGDRWGHDAVKEMLEILRDAGFPDNSDPVHYHRVTLFRHSIWRFCFQAWPWSGWLVPVVRSGHTTQNMQTCFLAPDDADKAQGIAGKVWSTRKVILVPKSVNAQTILPSLNMDTTSSPDAIRGLADRYADATFVNSDWIMKRISKNKPHARSFMGIPVMVRGVPWGVIVVDSRAICISKADDIIKTYSQIARPFIKCLERLP